MSYDGDRVRSVIDALMQVRDHVARGSYDAKYQVSIFNRWIDTLLGEPLLNARSLRLPWFYIGRDPLLLHLDATIAFLAQELTALEDNGGGLRLIPEDNEGGEADAGRAAAWTPRIVKE